MNLLITLLFGLPILLGTIVILFCKSSKKLTELSISMAFGVLLFLIFLELIPETLEKLDYLNLLFFGLTGVLLLKGLDHFIPEHYHSKDKHHISHIGFMSALALLLHNLIEGLALYTTLNTNITMGILIGIGVGLHNIPMGMIIGSTLKEANYSSMKIIVISLLVSLSTFLGGLLAYFFQNIITDYVLGIFLAITLGMLVYIVFFELLEHMHHQKKENNILGIMIGAFLFVISLFLHTH